MQPHHIPAKLQCLDTAGRAGHVRADVQRHNDMDYQRVKSLVNSAFLRTNTDEPGPRDYMAFLYRW